MRINTAIDGMADNAQNVEDSLIDYTMLTTTKKTHYLRRDQVLEAGINVNA